MKKYYLLITSLMASVITFAQPTVNSGVAGAIGDNISLAEVVSTGLDAGATGAGVTWDYSTLSLTGTSYAYDLIDPAATGAAASFPGANVAGDAGSGTYAFYKITSTEFTNYGAKTPAATVFYSDPEVLYNFPLTYNATASDDLYSEFTSGSDFVRSGTTTYTADGYGTLILPGGTITNVLRVLVHEVYSDVAVGFPITIEYDFKNYYWLKDGTIGPLFEYFDMTTNTGGFPTSSTFAGLNNSLIFTDIEGQVASNNISLYPNPASAHITVSGVNEDVSEIALFDMTGRQVQTLPNTSIGGTLTIDTQNLVNGFYTIQLLGSTGVQSKQFTVVN